MDVRRLALAVSPHLDDAAFSCGGTLAVLALAGFRVVVATLFTASVDDPQGFALACQLDKGLPAELDYMALRRDEDRAAMTALGAEAVFLPFEEAPHRGYGSAPALFGPVAAADRIGDRLAPALRDLLARCDPDVVLAPQAIGGHVDHVVAVRALRSVAGSRPVLWWRDFPYVTREASPAMPFAAEFDAMDEVAVPIDPDVKRRGCEAYGSQLGYQFGGAAGLARRLGEAGAVERFRTAHADAARVALGLRTPNWEAPGPEASMVEASGPAPEAGRA